MVQIFLTLLEISAASTVVILVITLLSSLINRSFTVKWKYWLWVMLALRLLIPFNISFAWAPAKVEVNIPAAPITTLPTAPVLPIQPLSPLPTQTADSAASLFTTIELMTLVWLAGTSCFLLWQTLRYLHFRRQVTRWGLPIRKDSPIAAVRQQAEAKLMIGTSTPALICKQVSSPMMIGFFRPLLILPHEEYSIQSLSYILCHELTHYKRRDIWYKTLMLFACGVHWFNPAVWLMVRQASRDLEISCDEAVMQGASMEQRQQYSQTILACIHQEPRSKTALSTHFYGGKQSLKERFAHILSTKKRRSGAVTFGAVLLCSGILGGLVACDTQPTADETVLHLPTETVLFQPAADRAGMTEAQLRAASLQQLQKRLAETICTVDGIEDAEILLEEDGEHDALRVSVLVWLRDGAELTQEQQESIRTFVFRSIPDIEKENIHLKADKSPPQLPDESRRYNTALQHNDQEPVNNSASPQPSVSPSPKPSVSEEPESSAEAPMVIENLAAGEQRHFYSDADVQMLQRLFSGAWTEGTSDCFSDFAVTIHGESYLYHADCGTFNDHRNNRSLSLTEPQRTEINRMFMQPDSASAP